MERWLVNLCWWPSETKRKLLSSESKLFNKMILWDEREFYARQRLQLNPVSFQAWMEVSAPLRDQWSTVWLAIGLPKCQMAAF